MLWVFPHKTIVFNYVLFNETLLFSRIFRNIAKTKLEFRATAPPFSAETEIMRGPPSILVSVILYSLP